MLLQVAVVLVRRALGRAEQRKKCEGQMETLEKLRGIREHVQEEADAFIAEVRLKKNAVEGTTINTAPSRYWLKESAVQQNCDGCCFAIFR